MAHIVEITLQGDEQRVFDGLIADLQKTYESVNDPTCIANLPVVCEDVPKRIRKVITKYKYAPEAQALIIRGFSLDQREIGPTPTHWNKTPEPATTADYYATLMSFVLGDVFGFSNLQCGKLIQEIFPILEDREAQLGTGAVELYLHTEDSALDYRADYLGFFCNKNPEAIPTDVAFIDPMQLSPSTRHTLKRKRFKIYNDRPVFTDDDRKNEQYTVCSVLYGQDSDLRVRYDPLYTEMSELTDEEKQALDDLVQLAARNVHPVVLQPGDMAFIDNTRCAHGRRAYTPKYDGSDRWLKRTQISNRLSSFWHMMQPGRVLP